MKENFYFPMKTMRVTQNYNGTTSHKKHWYNSKDYADYPIDIAGEDSGKSPVYAPVDMKVTAIKGIGSSMTNTIWLESVNEVGTPSGVMQVFLMLTHWNDNDSAIAKLKVGSIVEEGTIICYEGTDGATSNHIHLVVGKGTADSLIKNSNGSWVSNGYCMKPETLMYINDSFTKCTNSGDLIFKSMPKEIQGFLPKKGYFTLGDTSENIGKIANFMYKTFPAYVNSTVLGNYYGKNIQAAIKEFQRRTGLKADGCVGPITLKELTKYGFKY